MSLAQKLKKLRLQAGLTQEQLAARIGVSSRTIKHWEHGTRTPSAETCKDRVNSRIIYHFAGRLLMLSYQPERKTKMNVAYVRVSTVEQNETRQIEALKPHGIDKWFTEKISGKNTQRPQLQAMLDFVREGDTVFIHDFSRLARNTKDLLTLVEQLQNKGVHLISNKENLDTSTPTGKLMLTMIAAINEFERANTLERQREGIAIAKRNGVYKGRKPAQLPPDFDVLYARYQCRELNKTQLAAAVGVSRPTLERLLRDYLA